MKVLKNLLLLSGLTLFTLSSCGGGGGSNFESLDTSKLSTACELVDAMAIVSKKVEELESAALEGEAKEEIMNAVREKVNGIMSVAAEKNYPVEEMQSCPAYKKNEAAIKKVFG